MPLSDTACRGFKPGPKPIKKTDGGGLYLLIQPSGSKLWQMAYRFPVGGKQKTLSFGPYPLLTLAAARSKRDVAKRSLGEGLDPGVKAREEKEENAPRPVDRSRLFRTVADEWFDTIIKPTRKPQYAQRVLSFLERDVMPDLGKRLIDEITPADVLAVLRKMEARDVGESVKKVLGYLNGIFRYAKPTRGLLVNPASDLSDLLAPPRPHRSQPSLSTEELPAFFADLRRPHQDRLLTRLGVEIAIHTVLRTSEIRFGRWAEIKGDEWHIPGNRMKMGIDHIVPLSPRALALIERLRELTGDRPLMFPGRRPGHPISENTLLYALYGMGYAGRASTHGWRSTFDTWAHESGRWTSEWIETCLAHKDRNPVRAAYNKAKYLDQRRAIMSAWSDFLDAQDAAGTRLAIERDISELVG